MATGSRGWRRLAGLVGIALGGTLGVAGLLLGPDLVGLLPRAVRDHPIEWSALGLLAALGMARRFAASRPEGDRPARPLRRGLDGLEAAADWAFRRGLAVALAVLCAAMLATWLPHYLTWPWCRDLDSFATIAQSWDAGIRPYRDIRGHNFPGHIYLFWILGKAAGWGKTAPLYAVDAGLVVALAVALVGWSRRRLGGALPGLAAGLATLSFYLGVEYEQVAQRDWHAALCAAFGLLAAEAWPGRRGRLAWALATAAALTIRPHAILFLPAGVSAIDEGARRADEPRGRSLRALAEAALALVVFLALAFAPLLIAGVFDDFLRGLGVAAYGGPYSKATPSTVVAVFLGQFGDWQATGSLVGCLVALVIANPPGGRRLARTWGLALAGAWLYRPIHPVQHVYLLMPLALVSRIAVALPVAMLVSSRRFSGAVRLLLIGLVLYEYTPGVPLFCRPIESVRAFGPLLRGEEPEQPPPGCRRWFHNPSFGWYAWSDYRRTLAYLRRTTGPGTVVANVLRHVPHPSLNGPTGRLSPFLVESGICWMWLIDLDLDDIFAGELERAEDSVVVWCPEETRDEPRLRLPRVTEVILRRYEPEARFGRLAIWRRKPAARGGHGP